MPRQTVAFTPKKAYNNNTCSATAAATISLDDVGESVRVCNAGSAAAYIVFGTANQAVTTSVGHFVPSGQTEIFGRTSTHARIITASGSATLHLSVGDGV